MNCPYCSTQLEDNAKFCSRCGQRLPESASVEEKETFVPEVEDVTPEGEEAPVCAEIPAEPAGVPEKAPKAPWEKRSILVKAAVIAAVCVLVAASVILCAAFFGGRAYTAMDVYAYIVSANDEDTYLLYDNKGKVVDLKTDDLNYIRYSLDGSLAAVFADVENGDAGTLSAVRKGTMVTVAKDACAFDVSTEGGAIIYVRDPDTDGGKLCIYNVAKGESTEIAKKVMDEGGFAISPDGRSYVWAGDVNSDKGSFMGYVSVNGKAAEELGKNCYPVAVSDGGKYIYFLKMDDKNGEMTAYVRHRGNDEKLCTVSQYGDFEIWFNRDFTEAMFIDDDYRTFITVKGGEKQKISSQELYYVMLPRDASTRYVGLAHLSKYIVPCETFAEKFINLDGAVYFLQKDFEAERVSSDFSGYQVGSDCTSLLYMEDEELLYVKNAVKSCDEEEIYDDEDIYSFAASMDLSKIYVLTYDDELYSLRLGKEAQRVADDVYSMVVTEKGNAMYITDWSDRHGSGDLRYVSFGKDSAKICGDVSRITVLRDLLVYRQQTGEAYLADLYTGNGKTFTKIAEDVPAN